MQISFNQAFLDCVIISNWVYGTQHILFCWVGCLHNWQWSKGKCWLKLCSTPMLMILLKRKKKRGGGGLLSGQLNCDSWWHKSVLYGEWILAFKAILNWKYVLRAVLLYVLALWPFGRLQFPVAQHIIRVVCLYTIRRIPAIPMTAALPSWERISPGLQTGMLPFMAVSARCRWLACTRRYVPAGLKQRWLTQLQQATRKVCWGRKT